MLMIYHSSYSASHRFIMAFADAPMEGDGMVYDPNVEITLDDDAKEEDGMEVDG